MRAIVQFSIAITCSRLSCSPVTRSHSHPFKATACFSGEFFLRVAIHCAISTMSYVQGKLQCAAINFWYGMKFAVHTAWWKRDGNPGLWGAWIVNCATCNDKLSSSSFQWWWWHVDTGVDAHCHTARCSFQFFFLILALLEFYLRLSLVATVIVDPVSQRDVGPPFQSQDQRFCQVSLTMVIFHLGWPKVAQYEDSLKGSGKENISQGPCLLLLLLIYRCQSSTRDMWKPYVTRCCSQAGTHSVTYES